MTKKQSKLEIALDALKATNGDVIAAKTRVATRISTRTWYAAIQEFDQQTHGFIGEQEAPDWTKDRVDQAEA